MRTRPLGRTDLEVPVLTFGAWAIGGWYWGGRSDDRALAALRAAPEVGVTAIDTAPVYGFGHSEELIAEAIRGRRDEFLLFDKVGLVWEDRRGPIAFTTRTAEGRRVKVRRNARPDSVRREVEASLGRLRTDHLDLVQVHWPDPETPMADTLGALAELRDEGKVREVGVSNHSAPELASARRALGEVPLASDQVRYGLLAREPEEGILPWCRENGVGVLVHSPLEQGLLTGKVGVERRFASGDGRDKQPTFRPENRREVNGVLSAVVEPIANHRDATVAQVVLAWTLAREGVTSVLCGARTPEQVRENAAAAEILLEPEESAAIEAAFDGLDLDLTPSRPPGGIRGRLGRLARWFVE